MKKLILLMCFWSAVMVVRAQEETESDTTMGEDEFVLVIPPINEQLKAGVKMGSGVSTMMGNELHNPSLKVIVSGGVYLHYRFSEHWSLQPEVNVVHKGSNFKNGVGQYASISMYTMDVPLYLMYGLTEKNTVNIFTGMQYSYVLNRSLFLTDALVPESPGPKMRNDDWSVVLGTQIHTPFVGFQLAVKYGLCNLNKGMLPNLNPPNTGKDIHLGAVEFNFLF